MPETEQPWYVYILECGDGSLYTGVTTDVERRLHEHNHSAKGARYTRARRPLSLAYREPAGNRAQACRREWEIKQLSAGEKWRLISAQRPKSR
ncbi:MAG: GIY-YIG nuclease family protein [Sedimenticola sp.]|nr:GIY-YIG nuclease family protein [Sedimenticola sp.]